MGVQFRLEYAQESKIKLEASAEYFLDELFMDLLKNDKDKLLPFGSKLFQGWLHQLQHLQNETSEALSSNNRPDLLI